MTTIPAFLNGVTWEPVLPKDENGQRLADGAGLPHVTHEGVFELMGHTMKCFRLSNGQAVFEKEDFERFCETFLGIEQPYAAPEQSPKEKP